MTIQPLELTRATLNKHHKMLIGKDWRLADSKKTFEVFNPATGDVIATVPQGGPHDIDLAVQAARENFASRDWRGQSSDDRAKVLWRFAELIDNHRDEIAKLDVLDNGMPMALATAMISASSTWLRHFASESGKICGINASGALSSSSVEFHAYTAREPVGVAGLILAWNGPAGAFLAKAAPALAAGCSLVIKPADQTPLSALRLGELALEAGFPPGTLNIVTGLGDAGQALVEHPGVDKISFTGSTAVGKQIVRTAAETLKRVTLELGGKSPCIVFDDADMEIAIPTAAMSIFANTGQICFAGSRLYVQKKSFERVVAGVAQIAESLCVGDGFDSKTQIGPVISDKQRKRVEDYIALGREEGADIVGVGSSLPDKGFFVRPTVFTNAKPSM